MTIDSNTQFGPYQIIFTAGSGGMGKVYKARDTRLDRTVAIKVLLDLSGKPELTQRFEREARAIAALNHPHICTLFDVGRHEGIDYLVMEYLDGETLAARLERGPLPIEEVMRYGMQLADALEKAHRQGITHRDFKPANVMITPTGVKILDFGLAKFRDTPQPASATLSALPTRDLALTQQGMILGTLQYMSPEQVEGKDADARTDVFALGVVLYEMVTGRKAFECKSQVSLMAAILERDPAPMSSIRPVSSSLDRIVLTCMAKDPDDRFQTAREVLRELRWAELEKPAETTAQAPTPVIKSARTAWVLAGIAVIAVMGFLAALVPAVRYLREPVPDVAVHRFTIEPPLMPNLTFVGISPDGRQLAFTAIGPNNNPVLWVRPMDSLAAQPLPGTEGAGAPFWSPDSRSIVFSAGEKLKRIDFLGGAPRILSDVAATNGATWGNEGVIVFSSNNLLYRVSASGGQPSKLFDLDASKQETQHLHPSFLPDNKRFLFTASSSEPSNRAIYVASIETGERVRVVDAASMAVYSPPGFLLYQRTGTLMAQPFDAERAVVTGDAFPIAEALSYLGSGRSSFSVARNGTLVYTAGVAANRQLAWRDRSGKLLGTAGNPDSYQQARLSPDEKRAAYSRLSPGGDADIWLLDLSSGIASRFTADPANEVDPVWSSDGRQVAFTSTRGGKQDLYVRTVGASQDELLFASNEIKYLEDWSRDGQTLIFRGGNAGGSSYYALALTGERKAAKVFESPFTKDEMHLSPDSRWVAFNSNDSGRTEVYIASFPAFADKRQVSNAGGGEPFWRKDGRELFYLSPDGKLMSVEIKAGATLESGAPKVLFQTRIQVNLGLDQYSPSADGQKFLLIEPVGDSDARPTPITVVLDWTAALPQNQ